MKTWEIVVNTGQNTTKTTTIQAADAFMDDNSNLVLGDDEGEVVFIVAPNMWRTAQVVTPVPPRETLGADAKRGAYKKVFAH